MTELQNRHVLGNQFRSKPVSVETVILIVKDLWEPNSVRIGDFFFSFLNSLPIMAF